MNSKLKLAMAVSPMAAPPHPLVTVAATRASLIP